MADAGNLDCENPVFDETGYPAFLECSAVGRRWKSGLRESRLQQDELPVGNGEFDLQREVTQEELVKRDTLPGAQRVVFIVVVLLLNEPNLLVRDGASFVVCLLQGCPGLGFLAADQELIDFAGILVLFLSFLGSARVGDRCASPIGCTRSWSLVRRLIGFMRCWRVLGRPICRSQCWRVSLVNQSQESCWRFALLGGLRALKEFSPLRRVSSVVLGERLCHSC